MASIADAARPALDPALSIACATTATFVGTARSADFIRAFTMNDSAAEAEITARGDVVPWAGVNNTADAEAPVQVMSSFYYDKVVGTTRFT